MHGATFSIRGWADQALFCNVLRQLSWLKTLIFVLGGFLFTWVCCGGVAKKSLRFMAHVFGFESTAGFNFVFDTGTSVMLSLKGDASLAKARASRK